MEHKHVETYPSDTVKTKEGFASIELQKLDLVRRILVMLDELGDSDKDFRLCHHKASVLSAVSALYRR